MTILKIPPKSVASETHAAPRFTSLAYSAALSSHSWETKKPCKGASSGQQVGLTTDHIFSFEIHEDKYLGI